jgi:hypothetical protein
LNRTNILRLRSESNTDLVRQAVDMLNTAVHNITDEPGLVFCLVREKERECDYEVEFISTDRMIVLSGSNNVLGYCDKANKRIYVRLDVDQWNSNKQRLISVLMHEILHAIGLSHREEHYSLMNAGDTGVRGVTPYELADILMIMYQTQSDKGGEDDHEA